LTDGVRWIDDTGDLARVLGRVGAGPLAVDTEADSFHRYYEKVCLVQLSFDGHDYLVDPLSGIDLAPLGEVLDDPKVRKILHGADYDTRILDRDFDFRIQGLFDTMIAARLVGERAFGLASLVEKDLGLHLDKSAQLADWSTRPLPADLRAYAAADTRHLMDLAEGLEQRLRALERFEWAEEEFRRLENARWSRESADPEAFRRVKRSGTLDPRSLAVLREVYAWRDGRARERDLPPFRIAPDTVLVEIARRAPRGLGDLGAIKGLPGRLRLPREGREVLGAVNRAVESDPQTWPERRGGATPRRPTGETKRRLAALQRGRDAIAAELDIEPTVIASRAVLEAIVSRIEAGTEWREVDDLRGWQAGLLEETVSDS
jgi:ribonuclease D